MTKVDDVLKRFHIPQIFDGHRDDYGGKRVQMERFMEALIEAGNGPLARYLVEEKHANIFAMDDLDICFLKNGSLSLFKSFAQHLDINKMLVRAVLFNGEDRNREDFVRYLVDEKGANVNHVGHHVNHMGHEYYDSVLSGAILNGNESMVRLLIEKGADVNQKISNEETPLLHVATEYGSEPIVRILIENGADVNATDKFRPRPKNMDEMNAKDKVCPRSALNIAAHEGFDSIARLLIDNGASMNADPSYDYFSVLQDAIDSICRGGADLNLDDSLLGYMLDMGADVNAQTQIGSPLEFAIDRRCSPVVSFLVARGADVNGKTGSRQPLLHLAVEKAFHEKEVDKTMIPCLVENGVVLDATFNGATAFHVAVAYGMEPIARYLASKGAHVSLVPWDAKVEYPHRVKEPDAVMTRFLSDVGLDSAPTDATK